MANENDHIEAYKLKLSEYTLLAEKVNIIIKENLELEEMKPHGIFFRAKTVDSFGKKIKRKSYKNALNDITDLCGIRIICYVEDEVTQVCKLIRSLFEVDEKKSINKNDELGEDRVGYKSVHLICKLNKSRLALPEFKKFENLVFEVQVRTILQHSWAEIEHDKNYKFSGVLPKEIKRRLMLLSGTLELVDREFNQLSKEIDQYASQVNDQAVKGELDIPIDSVSLIQYLSLRFAKLVEIKRTDPSLNGADDELLREMKEFNLNTLKDLEDIIPSNFVDVVLNQNRYRPANFLGLVRDIMIIHDHERFFEQVKVDWSVTDDLIPIYSYYKIDVAKLPNHVGGLLYFDEEEEE
nr:hypothetical protein [uncultured Pedobacter sp.]